MTGLEGAGMDECDDCGTIIAVEAEQYLASDSMPHYRARFLCNACREAIEARAMAAAAKREENMRRAMANKGAML